MATDSDDLQGLNAISDVISNLLGILIVVLLVTSISMGYQAKNSLESASTEESAPLEFRPSQREWFPPFSEFYIVAHDKMAIWDLTETIETFEGQSVEPASGIQTVKTPSGVFRFSGFGVNGDIDSYYLEYDVNWARFKAQEGHFYDEDRIELFFNDVRKLSETHTVPCFFVYPSGMRLFSKIHARLANTGLRFRISTIHAQQPVIIYRHLTQFNVDKYYYQ